MRRRALLYTGLYIMIMASAIALMPGWRVTDWWLFSLRFRSSASPIAEEVMMVDVPYNETLSQFRAQVSNLLNTLAEKPDDFPKLVVLDVWVAADTSGIDGLKRAVKRLQGAKVPVYASINPIKDGNAEELDPEYMQRHAGEFYDLLDGHGHTRFNHIAGLAHYEPRLHLNTHEPVNGNQFVYALPALIAMHHYNVPLKQEPVIVGLGNIEELRSRIYTYRRDQKDGASFFRNGVGASVTAPGNPECPSFRGKVVVVGSLYKERNKFKTLSGPEILACAISERILPKRSDMSPEILESPVLLMIMTLLFSGLTVFFFHLFLRKIKAMRDRLWLLGLLSASTSLTLLIIVVAGLLALNRVYVQVSFVAISIAVTSILTLIYIHRGNEIALINPDIENKIKDGEELPAYDVFISYARTPENKAWVIANVYEPLRLLHNTDGTRLKVFFDQHDIPPGENWYRKLALSIQNSRFFLPVYTADYFSRKFCQFEMEQAALRHVELGDFIVPLAREEVPIPVEYSRIQYLDIRTAPDFMVRVADRMRIRTETNTE